MALFKNKVSQRLRRLRFDKTGFETQSSINKNQGDYYAMSFLIDAQGNLTSEQKEELMKIFAKAFNQYVSAQKKEFYHDA